MFAKLSRYTVVALFQISIDACYCTHTIILYLLTSVSTKVTVVLVESLQRSDVRSLFYNLGKKRGRREKVHVYLKATIIICRYIFLRFWLEQCFMSTNFCDLYVEMV